MAWLVLGLAPPLLFVTGFIMWWTRVVRSRWLARRSTGRGDRSMTSDETRHPLRRLLFAATQDSRRRILTVLSGNLQDSAGGFDDRLASLGTVMTLGRDSYETTRSALIRWLRQPQRVWLRRAKFQVHLWTSLALGLYLVVLSLTGSALVYRVGLDRMLATPRAMLNEQATP